MVVEHAVALTIDAEEIQAITGNVSIDSARAPRITGEITVPTSEILTELDPRYDIAWATITARAKTKHTLTLRDLPVAEIPRSYTEILAVNTYTNPSFEDDAMPGIDPADGVQSSDWAAEGTHSLEVLTDRSVILPVASPSTVKVIAESPGQVLLGSTGVEVGRNYAPNPRGVSGGTTFSGAGTYGARSYSEPIPTYGTAARATLSGAGAGLFGPRVQLAPSSQYRVEMVVRVTGGSLSDLTFSYRPIGSMSGAVTSATSVSSLAAGTHIISSAAFTTLADAPNADAYLGLRWDNYAPHGAVTVDITAVRIVAGTTLPAIPFQDGNSPASLSGIPVWAGPPNASEVIVYGVTSDTATTAGDTLTVQAVGHLAMLEGRWDVLTTVEGEYGGPPFSTSTPADGDIEYVAGSGGTSIRQRRVPTLGDHSDYYAGQQLRDVPYTDVSRTWRLNVRTVVDSFDEGTTTLRLASCEALLQDFAMPGGWTTDTAPTWEKILPGTSILDAINKVLEVCRLPAITVYPANAVSTTPGDALRSWVRGVTAWTKVMQLARTIDAFAEPDEATGGLKLRASSDRPNTGPDIKHLYTYGPTRTIKSGSWSRDRDASDFATTVVPIANLIPSGDTDARPLGWSAMKSGGDVIGEAFAAMPWKTRVGVQPPAGAAQPDTIEAAYSLARAQVREAGNRGSEIELVALPDYTLQMQDLVEIHRLNDPMVRGRIDGLDYSWPADEMRIRWRPNTGASATDVSFNDWWTP